MCVCVGRGSPGSSRCPGEGPPRLLGFLEGLSGIWRSAAGQAGRRWGGTFGQGSVGREGGESGLAPPGTGETCPLSSGLVLRRPGS